VVAKNQAPSRTGRAIRRFFGLIFVLALAAAAFYAGTRYREIREFVSGKVAPVQPTPSPTPDASAAFATKRAAVDTDPQKWLADNVTAGSKPFESKDAEFLYLYGRALMLTGNQRDAGQAFDLAIANLQAPSASPLPLSAEVKLAQAAAALKQTAPTTVTPLPDASAGQQKAAAILDELLGMKGQSAPK
jgi:hypothetical protein